MQRQSSGSLSVASASLPATTMESQPSDFSKEFKGRGSQVDPRCASASAGAGRREPQVGSGKTYYHYYTGKAGAGPHACFAERPAGELGHWASARASASRSRQGASRSRQGASRSRQGALRSRQGASRWLKLPGGSRLARPSRAGAWRRVAHGSQLGGGLLVASLRGGTLVASPKAAC